MDIGCPRTHLKRRLIASHEGIQVSGVCEVAPVLSENTHPYGPKSDLKPGGSNMLHMRLDQESGKWCSPKPRRGGPGESSDPDYS